MKVNSNSEILLVDNSITGDVYLSIKRYKNYAGSFDRTTVVRNKKFSEEAFQYFDYVILYNGACLDEESLEKANYTIILSDYTFYSRDFLLSLNINKDKMLVFVDKIIPKVSEKMMIAKTCFNLDDKIEVIEFSETDYKANLEFMYNGQHAFTNMSKDYQDALQEVASYVIGTDVRKLIKKK